MIKTTFIYCFLFGYFSILSQTKKEQLNIFSFQEVEQLHQQNPKPILVFTYTNWCKFCYMMKNTTFKNDKLIHLINDKFYFIKLNAEEKEDIIFLGKTFVFQPSGNKTGINELAKELASINKKISYPTTTILNSNLEIDLQIGNYINSTKMHKLLMNFSTLKDN